MEEPYPEEESGTPKALPVRQIRVAFGVKAISGRLYEEMWKPRRSLRGMSQTPVREKLHKRLKAKGVLISPYWWVCEGNLSSLRRNTRTRRGPDHVWIAGATGRRTVCVAASSAPLDHSGPSDRDFEISAKRLWRQQLSLLSSFTAWHGGCKPFQPTYFIP